MKIAVMSDIHCNFLSFKLAIDDAEKNNVDSFIFLGDYVTDGPWNNEVLEIVKKKATIAILGNREKYILNYNKNRKYYSNYRNIADTYESLSEENLGYIKSLKETELIEINGKKILLIHGDNYEDGKLTELFDFVIDKYDFDICLYGHIHIYSYRKYRNKIFINPGSIGRSMDYPTYKYCILNIDKDIDLELREFNVDDTYNELKNMYLDTNFYRNNRVWTELTLRCIRYGKSCYNQFFEILNSKLKGEKNISESEFNKIWDDSYIDYCKISKV